MVANIFVALKETLKIDITHPDNQTLLKFLIDGTNGDINVKNNDGEVFFIIQKNGWVTAQEAEEPENPKPSIHDDEYWENYTPSKTSLFNSYGSPTAW